MKGSELRRRTRPPDEDLDQLPIGGILEVRLEVSVLVDALDLEPADRPLYGLIRRVSR